MAATKVPGIQTEHCNITPNCRRVQGGDEAAFDVAVERLRKSYLEYVSSPANADADWHLVLTVHRDKGAAEA